jgi:hypothetical protein
MEGAYHTSYENSFKEDKLSILTIYVRRFRISGCYDEFVEYKNTKY